MDNPIHCCPRPKAEGNSVSGNTQNRGAIVLTLSKQASNNCLITQSSIHHADIQNLDALSATAIFMDAFL